MRNCICRAVPGTVIEKIHSDRNGDIPKACNKQRNQMLAIVDDDKQINF